MNTPQEIVEQLNEHLGVCRELLQATEEEGQTLRRSGKPSLMEFYQRKIDLLPPRELPSVNRQRPHFVADLYRRQGVP